MTEFAPKRVVGARLKGGCDDDRALEVGDMKEIKCSCSHKGCSGTTFVDDEVSGPVACEECDRMACSNDTCRAVNLENDESCLCAYDGCLGVASVYGKCERCNSLGCHPNGSANCKSMA